jgi:hypothetical protein
MAEEVIKIGLTGKMRSGKDSVADRLFLAHDFNVPLAFGNSLKYYAHKIFPWVPKEPKPRELYQFFNVMRDYDPDVWVKHLAKDVELAEDSRSTKGLVVKDARQPNEVEWLRNNGFIIVKVIADETQRKQRMQEAGESDEGLEHPTEKYVEEIDADYVLYNNGSLDELETKVDEMVQEIKEWSE